MTREFHGYQFDGNDDWRDRSIYVLKSPTKNADGFFPNVTFSRTPRKDKSLAQHMQEFISQLKDQRVPKLRIEDPKERTIAGYDALDCELRHAMPPPKKWGLRMLTLVRRQIIIAAGDTLHALSYADTAAGYPEHQEGFEQMLETLTLPT